MVMNGVVGGNHLADKLAGNGKPPPSGPNVGGNRKLTKNEKRRQKNKQKKAEAKLVDSTEKTMLESNGVAVASWPPPEEPGPSADDVVVSDHVCGYGICALVQKCPGISQGSPFSHHLSQTILQFCRLPSLAAILSRVWKQSYIS